jgi:hypothetical protein
MKSFLAALIIVAATVAPVRAFDAEKEVTTSILLTSFQHEIIDAGYTCEKVYVLFERTPATPRGIEYRAECGRYAYVLLSQQRGTVIVIGTKTYP